MIRTDGEKSDAFLLYAFDSLRDRKMIIYIDTYCNITKARQFGISIAHCTNTNNTKGFQYKDQQIWVDYRPYACKRDTQSACFKRISLYYVHLKYIDYISRTNTDYWDFCIWHIKFVWKDIVILFGEWKIYKVDKTM